LIPTLCSVRLGGLNRAAIQRQIQALTAELLVSVDYGVADQPVPVSADPTPFVEDEDFDFGLFVTRVLGDSERRGRMYR